MVKHLLKYLDAPDVVKTLAPRRRHNLGGSRFDCPLRASPLAEEMKRGAGKGEAPT